MSALEKAPDGPLLATIVTIGIGNVGTSIIVAEESEFGIAKAQTGALCENLRTRPERDGLPIGQNAMWIPELCVENWLRP